MIWFQLSAIRDAIISSRYSTSFVIFHGRSRSRFPAAAPVTPESLQVAGVVIDMSFLRRIRSIDAASASVDGGVRWIDLLSQTLTRSLTPPVFTDYIELSVGGTLSVGGIGGQPFATAAKRTTCWNWTSSPGAENS